MFSFLSNIQLNDKWSVRPFPTRHRVKSQGYIAYNCQRILKPQYQGLPGKVIGQAVRQGGKNSVYMYNEIPEVAYTGTNLFFLSMCTVMSYYRII